MCDTIAVVSEDRVLFAKNSDRDPNEAQLLEWHRGARHRSGERLRCTWIEIPQAPETNAILIGRPFWMWGAETGANEHGVVIGNEAVFTREPYAASGLTGMDLLRLALERAATAQDALEVITALLERYGQGGGCGHEDRAFTYHNSFIIADRRGAIVLETAGRHWAVEHVKSGARSISNELTIAGFAEQHSDTLRNRLLACHSRRSLTQAGAGASSSPADLMAVLRSHGSAEWPHYSPANGAMSAPCMHAGGLCATAQTTASWVAELRTDRCRHWVTATAAPCTSLFKPACVHEPLDLGPPPIDRFDPQSLWWRHELLHRSAIKDPVVAMRFTAERDDVERRWLDDPPSSADAFEEADELLRKWTEELPPIAADVRPWWVRRYWRGRDRFAGLDVAAGVTPARPGTPRSVR